MVRRKRDGNRGLWPNISTQTEFGKRTKLFFTMAYIIFWPGYLLHIFMVLRKTKLMLKIATAIEDR